MKLKSGYEAKKARVEMLPLIDVVFLLLVFFIYAMVSMVVHHGLNIDLPSAKSAIADRNEYIAITINEQNEIYLNDQPTSVSTVLKRVQKLRTANTAKPIFIQGDTKSNLGLTIQILDQLKLAGIEEVSIACEK